MLFTSHGAAIGFSLSLHYFSLGLFLLPDHALYFSAFSQAILSSWYTLPPILLSESLPILRAICKGSLKNLFFLHFSFDCERIGIPQSKISSLFLSNLCLFCTLLFCCEYLQFRDSVFNLCNFWNTLLIALHIAGRWDWIKKSQGLI